MKHIVCYSGGHSSAVVAIEVVRKYGKENVILCNHECILEDADVERFEKEVANYLGLPITYVSFEGHETKDQFDVVIEKGSFINPKSLTKEAISYELGNHLSKQTLQSPAGFETNAGMVSYSYKTGLRVFPEMQDLIATFNEHGIEVFIVSASYKPVVEVFSGIGNYGYNVPSQNVIAMELALDNDGKILPEYKSGWVKTQRQGKVDAINQVIKSGLGKNWDPLFSAADSDGDYEMSTGFPDMKLTLIWNRVKGGDIGTLCQLAVDQMNNANPRYILQGRNENTGMVIPTSESILFGKTEPQLLYE